MSKSEECLGLCGSAATFCGVKNKSIFFANPEKRVHELSETITTRKWCCMGTICRLIVLVASGAFCKMVVLTPILMCDRQVCTKEIMNFFHLIPKNLQDSDSLDTLMSQVSSENVVISGVDFASVGNEGLLTIFLSPDVEQALL